MDPKRTFIRTLGIAVAIIVILSGGILYVRADITEQVEVITQTRAGIRARENSVGALTALQSEAEKSGKYLAQIDPLLTSKEQLLGFSTDIGLLVQQSGFSGAPKFKEETAPSVGDLQKTNFSLTLEGSKDLSDLAKLLVSIERSKYFVRFVKVDVSRDATVLRVTLDGYVISF